MNPLLMRFINEAPDRFAALLPLPSLQDAMRTVRIRTAAGISRDGSVVHTEIVEDRRHMNLHGPFAELEHQYYFLVPLALNEEIKNVSLSAGQKMHWGGVVVDVLLRTLHFNDLRRFDQHSRRA